MSKEKDFKRLVRKRMLKTGESYTAARSHLVEPTAPALLPDDHEQVAGMSDAAVREKTGMDWAEWARLLDEHEAASLPHKEIAALLHDAHGVPGWWAQMVTVAYERFRGLRDVGQRRGGGYEINKSKTIAVPVSDLYAAFLDASVRRHWMPEHELEIRTAKEDKSVRARWPDGTLVDMYFSAKGEAKSVVSLQHRNLPSKETADERRGFWGERLDALQELLTKP